MSSFDFQVDNSGRTVQYKLNAQSLRLFGLHSDVNDVHRAGANRLQNKQTCVEPNVLELDEHAKELQNVFDNISRARLDPELLSVSRKVEIDFMNRLEMYRK